ncbi:DUF4145 domain-containing protein [Rummeliibacillus sp. POC4]|uniref:DUF4145 domain-containing protein n=1 Tax=Rummeliibacillus sp. POC4 TaxID=2305899 RepID=UPI000E66F83A|nr:DUF4145 domain-containing protein [Rummeliibacillus sp. POC4]RIJ62830.1 DUF4145 domain-containing protein [Rummeliibacillus sp. POC4]
MTSQMYDVLKDINPQLAELTDEIEKLIFVTPRAATQSMRTLVETLVKHVAKIEKMHHLQWSNFAEQQLALKQEGILTDTADKAITLVRKQGNIATHDGSRKILIREALTVWEYAHLVISWYIETYASPDTEVPPYIEPKPYRDQENDESLIERIKELIEGMMNGEGNQQQQQLVPTQTTKKIARSISYQDQTIEIPLFLRDAFLLPQRFPKSTTFLIRLNGEQQARIMSELPSQLEGLHEYVKRFKETNDATFFEELKTYVEEEIERKKIQEMYAGETLLFYKADYIILTDVLGEVPLTKENFPGLTSLVNSLQEQAFTKVADLPKELVLLGKYRNVGETALANLFSQLKAKSVMYSNMVSGDMQLS